MSAPDPFAPPPAADHPQQTDTAIDAAKAKVGAAATAIIARVRSFAERSGRNV